MLIRPTLQFWEVLCYPGLGIDQDYITVLGRSYVLPVLSTVLIRPTLQFWEVLCYPGLGID